jgi:hypothetical protein
MYVSNHDEGRVGEEEKEYSFPHVFSGDKDSHCL